MANLNSFTLEALARDAGFNQWESVTAASIALAESSGNPDLIGPLPTGHNKDQWASSDYGLWQINNHWHAKELATGNWRDPKDNARMAYSVYKSGGWGQWTTYKSGAAGKFTDPGATNPAGNGPADGAITKGAKAVVDPLSGIPSAIAAFGTAMNNTIRKIASNSLVMVLALVLLIVGIALLLRKPAIALAGAKVGGRTVNVVGDKAVGSTGEIVDRVIKADAAKPLGKHSAA